jgi:ribonuclease T1
MRGWLPIAVVLIVMVMVGWSQLRTSSTTTSASRTPTTIGSPDLGSSPRTTAPRPGCAEITYKTVDVVDLPDEALDTLALVTSDGPYPYRQDDGVFSNRERLLPKQPTGYYREYTVVTPGSDDRGARRIIAGECGERWYTDDHYDNFRLIEGTP